MARLSRGRTPLAAFSSTTIITYFQLRRRVHLLMTVGAKSRRTAETSRPGTRVQSPAEPTLSARQRHDARHNLYFRELPPTRHRIKQVGKEVGGKASTLRVGVIEAQVPGGENQMQPRKPTHRIRTNTVWYHAAIGSNLLDEQ